MNSDLLILSNNPLVWERADWPCVQVRGSALDVFYSCLKTLGAESHILYAHPVAGNARLLHNPFRTLLLEEKDPPPEERIRADIRLLEHFIRILEAQSGDVPESARGDYRLVDFELSLAAVPAEKSGRRMAG